MSTLTTPATTPAGPTDRPRPPKPDVVRGAMLVAEREVLAQLRSKSFLISTGVMLALFLGAIVISAIVSGRDTDDTRVAVVGTAEQVVGTLDGYEGVPAADEAAARELVRSGDVEAAVVPAAEPPGVKVIVMEEPPGSLVQALAVTPEVVQLDTDATEPGVRYLIAFGFGLVFFMSAMGFGSMIAQNTVTEKQSRIVELLLAAVPARSLLAGKILGNTALALGQTAALAAVSVLGLVVTGQDGLLGALGTPLVWFVLFFVVGFVLLAGVFAASASLVSRQEDVGTVMTPAMMLVMAPYFLVIFFNDNDTVLRVMSYVPFSAPVGMPMRLFLGDAAWWEPLVSLVVLALTALAVIAIGARIYERSLLRTGPRVRLREVIGRNAVA